MALVGSNLIQVLKYNLLEVIMKRIITFGTFDLLHIGHIRIIQRAAALGHHLVVGVSSDALNYKKKAIYPTYDQDDRMDIVRAIKGVDDVFLEESLELKRDYIKKYDAHTLVMGNDWAGKFDYLKDICEVTYLPRTEGISSTEIKSGIMALASNA